MEVSSLGRFAGFVTLLVMAGVLMSGSLALADDTADFDQTRRLALHEDIAAQNKLGTLYAKGHGVSQDYSQAIYWFQRAAEQGEADAQFNLGLLYYKGEVVRQNYTQAINWFGKAAKQGHKGALANLDEVHKEITTLRVSADQGKVEALVSLGDLYADGNGVSQDYGYAVDLYSKAVSQGYAVAQYKLGLMYEEGKGVPLDFVQSVEWYRKAIENKDAAAKYYLGRMYHNGRGVPRDNVYAYAWIALAADQGDKNAISNLGFAAGLLTPQQLIQARELVVQLKSIDSNKP